MSTKHQVLLLGIFFALIAIVLLAVVAPMYDATTSADAQPIIKGEQQVQSPTIVPTTYKTWIPKEDVPELLCIAVDPWGYGAEFGDQMRPCDGGSTVEHREKDREIEDVTTSPETSVVVIVTPEPVDDPIIEPPADNDTDDDDVVIDKPKTNNGNHYGDGNGNSGKDQPDNNTHDDKNKHDGDDTRADFEQTKSEDKDKGNKK